MLRDRFLERFIDRDHARTENVLKTDDAGEADLFFLDVFQDVHHVDGGPPFAVGMNGEVPFLIDREIIEPPVFDIVILKGFVDGPVLRIRVCHGGV